MLEDEAYLGRTRHGDSTERQEISAKPIAIDVASIPQGPYRCSTQDLGLIIECLDTSLYRTRARIDGANPACSLREWSCLITEKVNNLAVSKL